MCVHACALQSLSKMLRSSLDACSDSDVKAHGKCCDRSVTESCDDKKETRGAKKCELRRICEKKYHSLTHTHNSNNLSLTKLLETFFF